MGERHHSSKTHLEESGGRPSEFDTRTLLWGKQGVGKERAIVTENRIDKWFSGFEQFLTDINALRILDEPQRLFNADESGFSLGGKLKDMVLAEKGQKHVSVYKNSAKEQVTVMVATSATGDFAPPHILLPGIPDEEHVKGKPTGAAFSWNKKGWMDAQSFFSFVANAFHPFLLKKKIPLPVLLLVDGLQAHQSPEVARFCRDNGIILYRLPPHTTHVLQPCDLSVFRSLKASWAKAERQFRFANPGDYVTKATFARVFEHAWDDIRKKPTVPINGFKAAGIYPYTREYNRDILRMSSVYHFDNARMNEPDIQTPETRVAEEVNTPSTSARQQPTTGIAPTNVSTQTPIQTSPVAENTPSTSSQQQPDKPFNLRYALSRPKDPMYESPILAKYIKFPKIDVKFSRKRKLQLPEANSGDDFLAYVAEKKRMKELEEEQKKQRKEERERQLKEKRRKQQLAKEERERQMKERKRKQDLEKEERRRKKEEVEQKRREKKIIEASKNKREGAIIQHDGNSENKREAGIIIQESNEKRGEEMINNEELSKKKKDVRRQMQKCNDEDKENAETVKGKNQRTNMTNGGKRLRKEKN